MSKLRKGWYHATYYVRTWDQATWLVKQMYDEVASSFGEDDDQWSGLDLIDPGAQVTIREPNQSGHVRVDVLIPVAAVPRGYWLSPHCGVNVETFDKAGNYLHGEAAWWGMRFTSPRKRGVR